MIQAHYEVDNLFFGRALLRSIPMIEAEMTDERQHVDPQVEFVITAPEPYGAKLAYKARARMTLGVLTQLMSQAQQSLVIAAPFLQPSEILDRGPLAEALHSALQRGVVVDVVSTGSSFRSLGISDLLVIGHGQLRFFQPLANVEDERRLGSHAKFCIADGKDAYIGSANLTGAGMSGNLEMGLLVHGELAHQVEQFWKYLLEAGFFVEIEVIE